MNEKDDTGELIHLANAGYENAGDRNAGYENVVYEDSEECRIKECRLQGNSYNPRGNQRIKQGRG